MSRRPPTRFAFALAIACAFGAGISRAEVIEVRVHELRDLILARPAAGIEMLGWDLGRSMTVTSEEAGAASQQLAAIAAEIRAQVTPAAWSEAGGSARLEILDHQLIVRHDADGQAAVAAYLAMRRQMKIDAARVVLAYADGDGAEVEIGARVVAGARGSAGAHEIRRTMQALHVPGGASNFDPALMGDLRSGTTMEARLAATDDGFLTDLRFAWAKMLPDEAPTSGEGSVRGLPRFEWFEFEGAAPGGLAPAWACKRPRAPPVSWPRSACAT